MCNWSHIKSQTCRITEFSTDILEATKLQKLGIFPSTGEGEDVYSIGPVRIPGNGQSPKTQ
jgi:hypothetical protein